MLKNYFKGSLLAKGNFVNKFFSSKRTREDFGKKLIKSVFIFPNVNVDEFDFNEVNTEGNFIFI
jgi:hypothetical protein